MDLGETIGLIAVVILMTVFVIQGFDSYKRRLQFKQRELELRAAGAVRTLDATDAVLLQTLEQRLRVLERIATDRDQIVSAALATEIEDLRHATRKEGELQ